MPTLYELLGSPVRRKTPAQNTYAELFRTNNPTSSLASLLAAIVCISKKPAKSPPSPRTSKAPASPRAAQVPTSPGYAPWLVSQGWDPVLAWMMARLVVRHGKRVARDARWHTRVVKALRILADPGSKRLARTRKAAELLSAWKISGVIETLFDDSGLNVFEFIHLLEQAAARRDHDKDRLTELAATVVRTAHPTRGRRVKPASASHQYLLENLAPVVANRQAYTWSGSEEDYTDPLTQATRREFRKADLDPRPARRRAKARADATG
jgi:hypothetical protein